MAQNSTPDFAALRQDFPMLRSTMHGKPLIYFDSAATAQKPQVVIDAITNFYQFHYGTVHRAIYELSIYATHEYEATRTKVKALLNAAKVEEIIYTRGTTDGINLVAQSFGRAFIQPGDEILIPAMEHHSNIVPWQMLCEQQQAVLKIIPINEHAEIQLDNYAQLLSPKTKLVSLSYVSNSTGTLNPVKQMIEMAHAVGAKVLVDGAQSTPHMVVDVQDLDADFYVFSGHKFYGPTGIGILYGKEALLNAMPPIQGGGDMVDIVTFQKTTYNSLPLKFEAGTPMIAEAIALGTAIDYIQSIGLHHIHQREQELLAYATKALQTINNLRIIGTAKEKGAIISFVVNNIHPLDIGTLLDFHGIALRTGHHCAQPTMCRFNIPGTCRISLAFYNTFLEIDVFIEKLKSVLKSL
ncbi:MAG: cysteine desulfurase [Parachlamydiaceae bacterium]|nr:cysteine desulfurase [Parachlamydiaceae bacterium]